MTTMIKSPLPSSDVSSREKIYLRLPRDVWNAYEPRPQTNTKSKPKTTSHRSSPKRKRKPSPIKAAGEHTAKAPKQSPAQQRQCNVKVTRFQYGGPDRQQRGQHMSDVTLLAPCLQSTCANCWTWHSHLMHDLSPVEASGETGKRPDVEPLSPVGPALQDQQALHNTTNSPTTHESTAPQDSKYKILLPTPLLRHTVHGASVKSRRLESPRQRHTVRLQLKTETGKAEFRALLHERSRREIRCQYVMLSRMHEEIMRDTMKYLAAEELEDVKKYLAGEKVGDKVVKSTSGSKPKRRHRVRLVFKSEGGKDRHRRLVDKLTCVSKSSR